MGRGEWARNRGPETAAESPLEPASDRPMDNAQPRFRGALGHDQFGWRLLRFGSRAVSLTPLTACFSKVHGDALALNQRASRYGQKPMIVVERKDPTMMKAKA